jgi:hypothetical protein
VRTNPVNRTDGEYDKRSYYEGCSYPNSRLSCRDLRHPDYRRATCARERRIIGIGHDSGSGVVGVTAGHGRFLVAGTLTEFLPRGFTSVGVLYPTEYANWMCTQKINNPSSRQGQDLMTAQRRMTTMTDRELSQGMITYWYANTVRFQISQGALRHEYENGLSAYTDMVRQVIGKARANGLIVITVLQTVDYSCTPLLDGQLRKIARPANRRGWTQLLDPALTSDKLESGDR